MADLIWTAVSPLQHLALAGCLGVAVEQPGIVLSEVCDFNLVLVLARRGQWAATVTAASTHFGVEAPTRPQANAGNGTMLIWTGADQFLALSARVDDGSPLDGLQMAFAGKASLSDQSDGRAMIRISGPNARAMLGKLSSVDLDAQIFPVGAAAATAIDHTAVNLWRQPDAADGSAVFAALVFTSFADSLWKTIVDSSAEYGVGVGRTKFL